ncbi:MULTISPECIES: AMP-binding protein [unclassified Gilvimarinus]|uniref:AMP-binding protein n=1 Tax=Gilvimarinus sp. DZF01 TaxID=3461371 RepID=UPI004045D035
MESQLLQIVASLGDEMHLRESVLNELSMGTSLEAELGLDSLTRIELLARVERHFSVDIPEERLSEIATLGDLRNEIVEAMSGGVAGLERSLSGLVLEQTESNPDVCQTWGEVLQWHLEKHPDRPHIKLFDEHGEGEQLSFRQLHQGAARVAGGLQQRGLRQGDRVALMLPTGRDYFFAFMGVLLAGGIPVSLYPPTRPSQLEDHLRRHRNILENSGASAMIAFREVRAFTRLLKAQLGSLRNVYSMEDLSEPTEVAFPHLRDQDIAFLQYTSGSTGNPKGVILTHANLLANVRAMGERIRVSSKDVIVSWLPLYHDMGLIGCWLGAMYYSSLFVVMSPLEFIARPERWLWAIHRYRGTISAAPNFAFELCMKRVDDAQIEGLDLSSWRVAFNGAEAVSAQTLRRFQERFELYGLRGQTLAPVYGLAENSVGLAFPPFPRPFVTDRIRAEEFRRSGRAVAAPEGEPDTLEFVACGTPIAGCEVRIVDELNRELPQRQEGLLQFRGTSATQGYFHNPDESRKLFHGTWLNSGDRAYRVGADIYITGRVKDIIIHGGRNLYPEQLEEAVGNIPGIRKGCVAVFGSKDPRSGTEKLVVVAETRSEQERERYELESAVNQKTADVVGTPPDDVVLAAPHSVLKTSSGKVRRAATRAEYEKGQLGPKQRPLAWQIARLLASAVVPQTRRTLRLGASWLYTIWFWGVSAVLTPVIWLSVVLAPRPRWRWIIMRNWGRLLFSVLGIRIRLHGEEHLPPARRPAVFVGNHSSYVDVFALITAMGRPVIFVAKAELSKGWWIRTLLRKVQVEYVDRFDRQQSATDAERLVVRARQGNSLLFFPEGTLTGVSGLYPFHMGAFITAVHAGSPVVPLAIRGTREILHPDSWLPRPGPIDIVVDSPIHAPRNHSSLPAAAAWEAAIALRDQARASILRNSGEADLVAERPPIW